MRQTIHRQTPRLILRDFQEKDWPAVHRWGSDPDVSRFMSWGPNTEEQTRAFVMGAVEAQSVEPRTAFDLGVAWKDSGELIGSCGLHVTMPRHRGGLIGYCYRREVWGRGVATEAAAALLEFGFEILGLHRIFATCNPENHPSERVLRKIGMRREAHFRKDLWEKGAWRDTLLFAMLEEEWRNKRRP